MSILYITVYYRYYIRYKIITGGTKISISGFRFHHWGWVVVGSTMHWTESQWHRLRMSLIHQTTKLFTWVTGGVGNAML